MKRLKAEELSAYITGIIHGLAYARHERGGKKAMDCVLNWYFNGGEAASQIVIAFHKYEKHQPNAIVAAMLKQQCGK